jgi:PAS domain S-box-containing protein
LREAGKIIMPLHNDKGAVLPFTQPLPARQRTRANVPSEPALNVLVIDDTPQDRMAVRLALEAGGFMLQEAADAEQGLKLAASSTPDCILLDYVLPDAEGLQVLESLRQPGGTLPCAVVMLTGADLAATATKAGALDYLDKDRLDADTLRREIRSAVRRFRLIEAQRVTERRNAQLAAIVAASSDAIISIGTDLVVQTWNTGAQRLFGYGEAEARGRTLTELIVPDIYEAESAAIYAAVASGRAALLKETVRRRKDGQPVPVETNISPILDGSDTVTGLSVIFRDISERQRAEDALRRHAEQRALLLEVTSDLIRASGPGELGRMTFEHVKSALGAVVCTNYRLDPTGQRLRLAFVHGIPPEHLEAAQSLELGQEYCGTAAASRQPLVADKQRIASDPNGGLVRELGATAYACYPLKASDGRLLGTFAVASATREGFTEDEVAWLGTITNFLAQAWERFEAEQGLRASEERLRLSQEAAGLGHWDFDFTDGTVVWSEQTRKLLGVEPTAPASRTLLLSCVHPEDRLRLEEHIALSARPDSDHGRHLEFRIVLQNGAFRWLEDESRVETDAAGMPVRAVGIVRDITERKLAEQALLASKDRLQLALDAAQLGWWQYDPLHRVFLGDMRSQEIFDFTENEAVIEEVMKRVHPDDVEKVLAAIEASLDPADPKRSATEFRLQRRDSEVRWVETLGLACFEGAGRERRAVSFVGTAQDITERKEREEKEHLLMREINHRAKNMLSVVDAIAHQTAAKNPEDFVERFSERIQALSANQDLLVRNEWNGVEIEELVHAQLAPFAGLIGSRIVVHGPKLRLKAASAQAIGLALHELATNAGKYGALSTDMGRVDISWGTVDDTFTMSWIEREGPPVSAPKRRGFGTIVMEAMAERSVDGAVDLDYAPSGLTWRLTCPAASALESGWGS